jgi:Tfp pilus assembly protein PilV
MKTGKWLKVKIRFGNERGISLIEAAVAILLLGGGVLTLVMSMSSGVIAVQQDDQTVTAQGLARTQMEYVKEYPYSVGATAYPSVNAPEGYAITVNVASVPGANTDIQKVTVTINRNGNAVFTLQDYKVNR